MCNLHVFVCTCVFAVFQNLVCIHVDNYNFMEIFSLPSLRPHLQLRQIIEEGRRPNFLVLSLSFSSFCFCPFLSALCLLAPSFYLSVSLPLLHSLLLPGLPSCSRSSSSVAWTTYVWSLGWTQNHCYQRKCAQTSHNDFHLEPVHKHFQMHRDTLMAQAGCPHAFLLRRGCSHLASFLNSVLNRNLFVCLCIGSVLFIWLPVLWHLVKSFEPP